MNSKHHILATVSSFHAFNDGSLAVVTMLLPIFRNLFDLSYTQIGVITGGGLAIVLLTEMTVGRLFDKKNSRSLLLTGIALLTMSLALLSFSSNYLSLVLIVFLIKFASGFFHPAGISLISRVFKKDRIDRAMGIQSASGNFGSFLAIGTTLAIASTLGWTIPLYLWSLVGVIVVFNGFFLMRSAPKEYLYCTTSQSSKQTVREAFVEWRSIISRLIVLIPLFAVSITTYSLILSYLPLFLDEKTVLSLTTIGMLMGLWIGVGVLTSLFYERIQSLVKRKTLLVYTYLIIGFMGFILTITSSVVIVIVVIILLGISTFLSFPALFSLISSSTQEKNEGKTFGYVFTLQLLVGTILLFISGVLADIFGIWIPFAILGIIGFIAAIILLKRKELIEQGTKHSS